MQNVIISEETEKDRKNVCNIIKDAFAFVQHSDGDEHNLVERLRGSEVFIPKLSLVAVLNNEVVGYVLFTKLEVAKTTQLALAPLAVAPKFQKRGIGSLLVETGHKKAMEMGFEYSIVLGNPGYYSRFGYRPSDEFNIKCPFNVPREYFMAAKLQGKTFLNDADVRYSKEFLI